MSGDGGREKKRGWGWGESHSSTFQYSYMYSTLVPVPRYPYSAEYCTLLPLTRTVGLSKGSRGDLTSTISTLTPLPARVIAKLIIYNTLGFDQITAAML